MVWYNYLNYAACLFCGCGDITEIDFTYFDTSHITNIGYMFERCPSLTFLNLFELDTSNVGTYSSLFSGTNNLKYISLKIHNNNDLKKNIKFFKNVPSNVMIYINENNNKIIIMPKIGDKKLYNIECSIEGKLKQKNKIKTIDGNGLKLDNCFSCNFEVFKNINFTNFHTIENDPSNFDEYENYYLEPKGYYLDLNDLKYKKCYESCETCEIKGNNEVHNCLECDKNFSFINYINNYTNCYKSCVYYYYVDNENISYCTFNHSCPNDYPLLIQEKNECKKGEEKYKSTHIIYEELPTTYLDKSKIIENYTEREIQFESNETKICIQRDNINDIIKDIINYENVTKEMTKEEETEFYDSIIENIESVFTNDNYNTSKLDNGKDEIIQTEKMTITLTTSQNQRNNSNNNITLIDLGDCEIELRKYYNLTNNETLYIKKIDVLQEGMKIPKIEYSVYCKLSGTNLEKLNLSICENTKLFLSIPVSISESLDKFNSSSDYYNDKCYKSKSDSGTDMVLKDRQKEFVEGNKTVCQEECDFSYYDHDSQKANCSCKVQDSENSYANMNINKTKLYENFENGNDKKEISNIGITSCDVLGSKENIESNVGFFLLLIILVLFIIIFIIFCSKGYNSLENKIDEVIHKKFKNETKNKNNIKKTNSLFTQTKTTQKKGQKSGNKRNSTNQTRKINNNSRRSNLTRRPIQNYRRNISLNTLQNRKNKNLNINKKSPDLKPDTDYELNWLSYKEAIRFDKRTNCEYYGSLIKSKQLILFTFCSFNDYNSGIVKKFMFFLSFALHYTTNALFFTESTMHQIYEDEGKFNFEYQYPKIIYSAIISTLVLRLMLIFLVLTDRDVLEVKKRQTKDLAIKMKRKKLKCMKIKFAIFFILNFILLGLFWYYLTCFNAIYENTQVYLIKNTFISFAFSLFYPFIINIFPTFIRMYSLHSSNKDQECFYKASQIIQLF